MRASATMTRIVDLCFAMDNHATRLYRSLAGQTADQELKRFWQDIAEKNEQHGRYWELLLDWTAKGMLDHLFDDSRKTGEELARLESKVRDLAGSCLYVGSKKKAFTMAFKLEFYLLHPAFETLSQYVATFNADAAPDLRYERFVNPLFDALQQNELSTLELELVGEVIHRLWKENRRMAFLSNYDELTGVFNRRGLFNAINHLAHLAQRNQNTVGVLMIDIDHFKSINDNYGHQYGDETLRRVAGCIRESIRASDVLGRYGGEEFLVFLSSVESVALGEVGEKVRRAIESMPENPAHVTVSIGIAHNQVGREVQADIKALIHLADERLLIAKASGRNRIEL
ncbi:GGDEF domain-containing protein [Desulfosarcina ovata subsp. sediminis]|uniref:diguanylate cyclase n=1 Tax=Desulfosarcina ovata subsp. sediminis TaxID=885957 RepID=A0A5K8A062_9BACT|nr:GGDEF domain-containing protein [Desulfosarcina ovata]BBO85919.1 GGDEF domain-containing protein [Desulfosarcina ovata subsp. sediminis]